MTISSSTSFEFDVAAICKMAYREASILNENQTPTNAQASVARDELQRAVSGSQAKGLFARVVKFELVSFESGVDNYTLPQEALDVVGTAMYVPAAGTSAGESQIQIITRDEYQSITNKATTARPTRYFPLRTGERVVVYFWPVPTTADVGASARLQTHRIRANVRDPNATVDYEQYWVDYLTTELAYRLAKANSMPMEVREPLRQDAALKLAEIKPMAMQRGSQQFVMSHRTGWSSR